jgi:thioredoxin-related protein
MKKVLFFFAFCLLFTVFAHAAPPDTLKYFDGSFKSLKREAVRLKQPYALLFGASWCAPCHALRRDVLNNDVIASFANSHFLIKYIDLESFEGLEVNNEFKVNQLPAMLFFDANGKKIDEIIGLVEVNQMYKRMRINSGIPISRVYETISNDTIEE